jgi:octaheme c-type cytochrome (tetrathionate reductase family)
VPLENGKSMRSTQSRNVSTASRLLALALAVAIPVGVSEGAVMQDSPEGAAAPEARIASTADHSQFEALQVDFPDGPAVTTACLTCHTEAAKQIMKTSHWTWICHRAKALMEERSEIAVGKAEHVVNNFCIALASNEPRCTSCHAGYGWKDKTFDFTDETRVDCLICHDQTRTYEKFPTSAGHPVYEKDYPDGKEWPKGSGKMMPPVDLSYVAQNVGTPTRHNCGTCHFFGGGGEGVKHGDMDVNLDDAKGLPHRSLDVHMAADGADFNCTQCHTTVEHQVAGRCFEFGAYDEREFVLRGLETNLLACESCHSPTPHREINSKLDDHADKVSCQACHIPRMAREKATKMWWDWSKAGKMNDKGKPLVEKVQLKDEKVLSYHGKKGEFIWAKDEVPDYVWFNGTMKHTFIADEIDDVTPVKDKCDHSHGRLDKIDVDKPVVWINRVNTDYADPKARIWPAKIHRGIQPYDPENKRLVIPKLFPGSGSDKGEAYWKSFDWDRAITAGMKYADLPYSGKYDWIQTEMIWPLKHTVAPKEDAVGCAECHVSGPEGRLADLGGFYMPGRDRSSLIDGIGIIMVLLSIAGAVLHGILRVVLKNKGAAA